MNNLELLTTQQLAEYLKVTIQSVSNWRKDGMPVFVKTGNVCRYKLDDVVQWLNNRGKNGRKSRLDKAT